MTDLDEEIYMLMMLILDKQGIDTPQLEDVPNIFFNQFGIHLEDFIIMVELLAPLSPPVPTSIKGRAPQQAFGWGLDPSTWYPIVSRDFKKEDWGDGVEEKVMQFMERRSNVRDFS